MYLCKKCKKSLSQDEQGLYRKLVDMETEEFLCIECLAEYFGCTVEFLRQKIKQFKTMGCFLFEKEGDLL